MLYAINYKIIYLIIYNITFELISLMCKYGVFLVYIFFHGYLICLLMTSDKKVKTNNNKSVWDC